MLVANVVKKIFLPFLFALIFYLFTSRIHLDNLFFNYPNVYKDNMLIIKMLYFVFLCAIFYFIFYVKKEISEKNQLFKRGIKIFCIYFVIIFIILLLIWPGSWNWDDVWNLYSDYGYDFNSWHHILTTIFHQIFLQILPFPAGIIIIQNIIISIIVSFVIVKLENVYSLYLDNKFIDFAIKIMPFVMLPVLRYQLSGNRNGFYLFFELLFLVLILCSLKEKKEEKLSYLLCISCLCALVSNWRSEGFIYLIFGILFFVFNRYLGSKNKRYLIIAVLISVYFLINHYQSYYIKLQHAKDYTLTATVSQAADLIRVMDKNKDGELLRSIDRVLNVQAPIDYPQKAGIDLYWEKKFVKLTYTDEDYNEYLKALIISSFKYPKTLLFNRLEIFKDSMLPPHYFSFDDSRDMINIFDSQKGIKDTDLFFRNSGFILNSPVSTNVRNNIIKFISCTNNYKIFSIVWNSFYPLSYILLFLVIMILKKQKAETTVISGLLIKQLIVVLFQPVAFFQYYLSIYIIGYIIFFYYLISLFSNSNKKL